MKGKKRLTACEQKALVALKAEEIQEKAKKAKQREKKRESTSKVRTALGGQQISFQPQPQVEAPLRYPVQQQERLRLSDPWAGFGQNVALTLLNYGLMQAGRHQDRQMLAAQQQQRQPEYKDVPSTIKKGSMELSPFERIPTTVKKRKIEATTAPAFSFKTPTKTNISERKKFVANKSSEAGGLFDKFINRTTQSTQTEAPTTKSTGELSTQTDNKSTKEQETQWNYYDQSWTEEDLINRPKENKDGPDISILSDAESALYDKKKKNLLGVQPTPQERRNAIDKMEFTDLLMAMADDKIHPDDLAYAKNREATLRNQLFSVNEKGQHFLETNTRAQNISFFKESYKGGYIGSPVNTRGNVDPETGQTFIIVDGHRLNSDGTYELHSAGSLIQQTPEQAMEILERFKGPIQIDRPTNVKPPPENATSLSEPLSNEELEKFFPASLSESDFVSSKTPINRKFKKPVITPPPAGGYDPKKLIQSFIKTDTPVDLKTTFDADTLIQRSNEAKQRFNAASEKFKTLMQDSNEIVQRSRSLVNSVTPLKNRIYAPASPSLDQSPAIFGFHGPSAYPASVDANVTGFYNKLLLKAKGGTPATIMMGSSPSSMMSPYTPSSNVEMSSFISDLPINERPSMQSFEIENVPEVSEYTNFGSGFDNPNIETEYENVGPRFTGE